MKQKDIALIAVIIVVSGVFSLLVSRAIVPSSSKQKEVEVVEPITADFSQPSDKYFNEKSTNLTHLIEINENQNEDPFN